MSVGLTPSQTVGPFLHIALAWPDGPDVVPEGTLGAFRVGGRVLDGTGEPVSDGLIETWQADEYGYFAHSDDPRQPSSDTRFRGFGRCPTGPNGEWSIRTVKPGSLPTPDGELEAPHIVVSVFARGLLDRLVTRIYFADEAAANESDPVLSAIPAGRRSTLIGAAVDEGYRFDIRLQGDHETVFFSL